MYRNIFNYLFAYVGVLQLKRNASGRASAYTHTLAGHVRRNRYAGGPFCDFELAEARPKTGVYALAVEDEVTYVGECENLKVRFGPMGYGHVSPRNCHIDGQSTNCKVNSLVLQAALDRDRVHVWFLKAVDDRKSIESQLIRKLHLKWNGRVSVPLSSPGRPLTQPNMRRTLHEAESFGIVLGRILEEAQRSGGSVVRVRAGDLHRRVGGYPGPHHGGLSTTTSPSSIAPRIKEPARTSSLNTACQGLGRSPADTTLSRTPSLSSQLRERLIDCRYEL
jgi:hypothetical protein